MQPSHHVLLESGWSPRAPLSPDLSATAPSSSPSQLQSDPFWGTEIISPNYSQSKKAFLKQASKVLAQNAVLKPSHLVYHQAENLQFLSETHTWIGSQYQLLKQHLSHITSFSHTFLPTCCLFPWLFFRWTSSRSWFAVQPCK